jgi:cysteine desulfurase
MRCYLDYNATAPLRPEARQAMLEAFDVCGNPSSIHAEGRAARALVETARRDVAGLAGAAGRNVAFTSGGTEAVCLALAPGLSAPGFAPLRRLVVCATEHTCAFAGNRFAAEAVEIAPVSPDGRIDLEALRRLVAAGPPALVALQAANNETGVLQPVAEAADIAHASGGLLVCDAAQAAGRLPLAALTRGADAMVLSAHKFGGPKGAGAFIGLREGLAVGAPLLRGGGQERGRRAGTENVAGIAGFGAAARAAAAGVEAEAARLAALRDGCEQRLKALAPDAALFGAQAPRLPNTLAFAIPGLAAATLLMRLDLEGVAVSSGSACSSGKVAQSHVLAAMGVAPELAAGAIRVSLGWASGEADVEAFAGAMARALAGVRRKGR